MATATPKNSVPKNAANAPKSKTVTKTVTKKVEKTPVKIAAKPKIAPAKMTTPKTAKSVVDKATDLIPVDFTAKAKEYRDKAEGNARKFADQAGGLASQAGDRAKGLAQDGKDRAVDAMASFAKMIEDNAGTVDEKVGKQYGDFARTAAKAVAGFATSVEQKDIDELAANTRDFVKKSPAVAIGAAAVVGFVLARLLKSSGSDDA